MQLWRPRAMPIAVLQTRGEEPGKMRPGWYIHVPVQVMPVVWHQAGRPSAKPPGMVWLDTSGTSHSALGQDEHHVAPSIPPSHSTGQQYESEQSRAGLAGQEPHCSAWGFCYLLFTARAARAVTIINEATAREQSSLVSCTPQTGQGKHTTSLHFKRGHAHCTSARARPRAKPA